MMARDDNLFYACSLIEFMARKTQNTRKDLVDFLQPDIERIYNFADVFHCEPIEKVADDFTQRNDITKGDYDVTENVEYAIPSHWDIGRVFEHLIEDTSDDAHKVEAISEVFSSWLAPKILNFNSDLYYQPREYLAECYREGKIITE